MIIHTFTDQRPPARIDAQAWNRVRVEEATDPEGTWSTLVIQTFVTPDADPTDPVARDIVVSSEHAEAYYRLTFLDSDSDTSGPGEPFFDSGYRVDADFASPTLSEVGGFLRARTKDSNGAEQGTFTVNTRPTNTQVESLIDQAVGVVAVRVGALAERLRPRATHLAALYTALLIEISYFPEQLEGDDSAYGRIKELYDEGMASLVAADVDEDDALTSGKGLFSVPMSSDAVAETWLP